MRKLRHTIERQASTLNDDTEHLQSCFLWLRKMDKVSKAQHAGKGLDGKPPHPNIAAAVPADALEVTPPREAAGQRCQ